MYYSPCRGRRWSAECCWFKVVEVVDFYILLRREGFASEIYFRVSFEVCRDKSPRPWVEKALCLLQKRKEGAIAGSFFFFAEREGFEPPEPLSSTVFKTAAIDHSAISPSKSGAKVLLFFQIHKFFAKILANMRKI